MPGQSLRYTGRFPRHPPGLYLYTRILMGESHRQVLDGMSGAIVIEELILFSSPGRSARTASWLCVAAPW